MLACTITCWLIGLFTLFIGDRTAFDGWMIAALLFALASL